MVVLRQRMKLDEGAAGGGKKNTLTLVVQRIAPYIIYRHKEVKSYTVGHTCL